MVALVTLALTSVQLRNDYLKRQIKEWQDVAVFSIISDAPLRGLTISEIQAKYKEMANDLPKELPREEIQTQALKRTLLNLISSQAITFRNDGRYGVVVGPFPMPPEMIETRQVMQEAGSYILQVVVPNRNQYTLQTLAEKVHRRFQKLTDEQFNQLIGEMRGKVPSQSGPMGGFQLPRILAAQNKNFHRNDAEHSWFCQVY